MLDWLIWLPLIKQCLFSVCTSAPLANLAPFIQTLAVFCQHKCSIGQFGCLYSTTGCFLSAQVLHWPIWLPLFKHSLFSVSTSALLANLAPFIETLAVFCQHKYSIGQSGCLYSNTGCFLSAQVLYWPIWLPLFKHWLFSVCIYVPISNLAPFPLCISVLSAILAHYSLGCFLFTLVSDLLIWTLFIPILTTLFLLVSNELPQPLLQSH